MEINSIINELNIPIGFLAAIIAIIGSCITVWKYLKRTIIKIKEPSDIQAYLASLCLRNKYKIAIVDDELRDFPIEYMRSLGYAVSTYETISLSEVDKLLSFDIIFLDVKGVVKEDLDTGGAKLLKLIKKAKSNIMVVAVSSGKYQLKLTNFFESSDDVLNKPINESEIENIISQLIENNINIESMAKKLSDMILCSKSKQQKFINKSLIKFFSNDLNFDNLREVIHQNTNHKHSEKIANLAEIISWRLNFDK